MKPIAGREALQVHARIKSIAEQQGIDYEIAARQIYHAELARLEAICNIQSSLSAILEAKERATQGM